MGWRGGDNVAVNFNTHGLYGAHRATICISVIWVGVGVGRGQVSTSRAKNNKRRSFPPTLLQHTYTRAWLTTGDVHYPPYAKKNLVPSLPCCHTALCTCQRKFH